MRIASLVVVLLFMSACGEATSATSSSAPSSTGDVPDGQLEIREADWPPFRAVFRETSVPEDMNSAGTVEEWEIVYRGPADWEMTALDGQTTGNRTLPDGTRFTENVDPGTTINMSADGLVYSFPDGTSTKVTDEESAPSRWLQPRYASDSWQRSRSGDATIATAENSGACAEPVPSASETTSCIEVIRAELNQHGVPVEYTEAVDDQIMFTAETTEFELLD